MKRIRILQWIGIGFALVLSYFIGTTNLKTHTEEQ